MGHVSSCLKRGYIRHKMFPIPAIKNIAKFYLVQQLVHKNRFMQNEAT